MKKYLLDTNIISYLEKQDSEEFTKIFNNLNKLNDEDVVSMSILTIFEYQTSIVQIKDKNQQEALIKRKKDYIENFNIENLKLNQEIIFAELKKQYMQKTGITSRALNRHNIDLILASQSISEDMILVSNDNIFKVIAEFRNDFKHQNWIN